MEHSKDSRAFRDEFEDAKQRQDQGLDEISKGLSVLKNLGGEMDDEIKRQTPILDVIDEKLDSTTAEMRTANGKLEEGDHVDAKYAELLRGRHPHLHHPRHRHVLHEQLRLMNM